MGKQSIYSESGKLQRCLNPMDAQKKAQKRKLVQQKEEVKRRKKFEDQITTDAEAVRRRVSAMDKKDKMGMLTQRQKNEKKEMKELLQDHESKQGSFGRSSAEILAGLPEKREYEVTMLNAFGSKMAGTQKAQTDAAAGGVASDIVPYDAPNQPKPAAKPRAAGATVGVVTESAPKVEDDEPTPEVEVQWNHNAMMSMVPSSVLRRKRQQAHEGRAASRNIIPGSSVTTQDLAATMAPKPAVPLAETAAAPAPAAPAVSRMSFKTVNLVPDYDDEDDDEEDDPLGPPPAALAAASAKPTSMFFGAGGVRAPAPAPAAAPPEPTPAPEPPAAAPAPAGDLDAEYLKFMAAL